MNDNPKERDYEYEVDLRKYFRTIWNEKWIVIAITIVTIGASLGYSLIQDRSYLTETTLLLTPKISEQLSYKNPDNLPPFDFSPATYERLATANDLLSQIIARIDSENENGNSLTVSSLKGQMEPNVSRARGNEASPLMTMKVKGSSPKLVKDIANVWAQIFIDNTTEMLSSERTRSYEFISSRLAEVEEKLKNRESEKIEFLRENPIGLLKSRLKALTESKIKERKEEEKKDSEDESGSNGEKEEKEEIDLYTGAYQRLQKKLESKKSLVVSGEAKVASINESIRETEKFRKVDKSISKEPLKEFVKNEENPDSNNSDIQNIESLTFRDEFLNENYIQLKKEKYAVQSSLASAKSEIDFLNNRIELVLKEARELEAKIARREARLKKFNRDIERLRETYENLSLDLEDARIAKQEKKGYIRVVEKAVTASVIGEGNLSSNIVIGGILGLLTGAGIILFRKYMEGH